MDRSIDNDTHSTASRSRIDSMHAWDRGFSILGLLVLWTIIGFVCIAVNQLFTDAPLGFALYAGAFLVLIFNTASVFAMLKHYRDDKDHIYGLDIHHLDANRLQKALAKGQLAAVEARP